LISVAHEDEMGRASHMNEVTSPTTRKRAGLLESAMHKFFMRNAQVVDVEDVGAAFRVVTLGGESLRNAGWTPGNKLQIQLGGWVQRTYTPIDWDAESGRTRILVHLHSGGPGAQWAHAVRTGSECIVFGPRKSIDLTRLKSSAILFGDETSFGLAAALIGTVSPTSAQMFFEVSSVAQAQPALRWLRLDEAHVSARRDGEAQLTELEEKMLVSLQAQPSASVVLTGKADSIQHMRRLLRRVGVGANRFQAMAYWKPGKTGLD